MSSSPISLIIETRLNGILQFFSCRHRRRAAMLNKIWCRKLKRGWNQGALELPPEVRLFSEPKYQNNVSIWYICYRSIITILWMSIIVCSIFELGSKRPRGKNYLWPIYLTNWDLLFGLVQSVLAFVIVKRRWNIQQSKQADVDANNLAAPLETIYKCYWFFYTVTLTLAISVSTTYWILVYNPLDYTIDALNIMVHVCNTLLIICDFIVTNVPLKFRHFWWSLAVVIIYLVFTIIYYTAGGLDKRGKHCIYDSMDWDKPAKTILLTIGALVFLIIVHCLFCCLTMLNTSNTIKEDANNKYNEIINKFQHHMEIV